MSNLPEPNTRKETFLASAAGMSVEKPTPITREEIYLDAISGGGGDLSNYYTKSETDAKYADKSTATATENGLMSSTDKTKLDSIQPDSSAIMIDSELNPTSTNAVQNRASCPMKSTQFPALRRYICERISVQRSGKTWRQRTCGRFISTRKLLSRARNTVNTFPVRHKLTSNTST